MAQTSSFSYSNVRGVDSKTDSLPYFMYDKVDLDSFLLNNQIISPELEWWGINTHVYMTFNVDTLGKPYDLRILKIDVKVNDLTVAKSEYAVDSVKKYLRFESSRLIYLTEGMWIANSNNFNNRLNIILSFRTEAYDDKNAYGLKARHNNRRPGDVVYDYSHQGEIKSVKKIYKYYDFGVQAMNKNKLLIAQRYFEQALKVKNDDVDALYNLGVCFFKEKKKDKACDTWIRGWQFGDKGAQELLEKYCK
jgi:tetratricopeptide (TPR) repeat protein